MTQPDRIADLVTRLAVWCEQLGHPIDAAGRVSEEVAAEILGKSARTLANWRAGETGPPHYRERPPRYALADLAAFIERQRTQLHASSRIHAADESGTRDARAR